MRRNRVWLALTCLATVAAAACGGGSAKSAPNATDAANATAATTKAGGGNSTSKLVDNACASVSLDDIRKVLADAKPGEGQGGNCTWFSAAKSTVNLGVVAIKPPAAQAVGIKEATAKEPGASKVDVGDVGYYYEQSSVTLIFFKGDAIVTLEATGLKPGKDAFVALGKQFAATT